MRTAAPPATFLLALLLMAGSGLRAEWRRVGTAAIDLHLNGLATGPVDSVGWTAGGNLLARAATGVWLSAGQGDSWNPAIELPAEAPRIVLDRLPDGASGATAAGRDGWAYAYGAHVWRTEDYGRTWRNLTQWKTVSLLGGPVSSVAVRPGNPEHAAAATATGVWSSADAGITWTSRNAGLPQLPLRRIVSLPQGAQGLRVSLIAPAGLPAAVLEWSPGERSAWTPASGPQSLEQAAMLALSREFGVTVSALAYSGNTVYAGAADGRIFVSLDRGSSWLPPAQNPGASVEAFSLDPSDPRRAVAALRRSDSGPSVLRTINGGMIWDDATGSLGHGSVLGIAADFEAGAVYAATPAGVYWTRTDLTAMSPPTPWRKAAGTLPDSPVLDVRLDALGQTLYAAVYGYGVYRTEAEHSLSEWRIVSSADWAQRPAAPGALLSILGRPVDRIRAGERTVAVLHRGERETQVQLPFDLEGTSISLQLESADASSVATLALADAAPAILIDRDGAPMISESVSGALVDAGNPARAGDTVRILVSGLGRVTPSWPAGIPAPSSGQTPEAVAAVEAFLDGRPLEVERAALAPGYIGYYLVDVRLPDVVDSGAAGLFLRSGNSTTNTVRLYIEQ